MERWEGLLELCGAPADVASFSRVTQTAEAVLGEDLADFEIEWIASTFLYEPVSALQLISERGMDGAWSKPIADCFKVFTTFVEKYPHAADDFLEDIVAACSRALCGRACAAALRCARACVPRRACAPPAARRACAPPAARHVAELEARAACRAPRALLLAAICEYHPEEVAEDAPRIWRAYLNLLDTNKNTDAVCSAALRGACSVLRHFGEELSLRDVTLLYPALAGDLLDGTTTRNVILEILTKHADLFREQLLSDAVLRRRLWAEATTPVAAAAARAVTEAAIKAATTEQKRIICEQELVPLTSHRVPLVKFTALRVLRAHARDVTDASGHVDVYALEFQLKNARDKVPDDVVEAVSWCVEAAAPHSSLLLQTALLQHALLPPALLVAGLARDQTALSFLITESCRPGGWELYESLWKELSADARVCDQLVEHTTRVLRARAAQGGEFSPEESSLLRLVWAALAEGEGARGGALCAALGGALHAAHAPPPHALRLLTVLPDCDELAQVYQRLECARMRDEESADACAGALLHAPRAAAPPHALLDAAQRVLSGDCRAPATVRAALRHLATLAEHPRGLRPSQLAHVMRLVDGLRHRFEARGGKHARELHRDVLMFLGKYWEDKYEECESDDVDALAVELRDQLSISVPAHQGQPSDLKIYLHRILKLSLEREDVETLEVMTSLLCSLLESAPQNECAARALSRVLCARAHAAARGHAAELRVPHVPGLALQLLQRVRTRRSAGARRVQCAWLRPLLAASALRHAAGLLVRMLHDDNLTSRLAGLDAALPITDALKENTVLAGDHLPTILLTIAATNEPAAREPFRQAAALYADIVTVFSAEALDITLTELLKLITTLKVTSEDEYAYKETTSMVIEFLAKAFDSSIVMDKFFKVCERNGNRAQCLYALAQLKRSFALSERVLEYNEWWFVRELFALERETDFETEVVFTFVAEFAGVLLTSHNEGAVRALCGALQALPPRARAPLRALSACAGAVGAPPRALALTIESWVRARDLQRVAEHIESHEFPEAEVVAVSSVRALLQAWPLPHPVQLLTDTAAVVCSWPHAVLQLYAKDTSDLKAHMPYLQDVVWLGLFLGAADAVKRLLMEDLGKTNLAFSRDFMPALYRFLVCKPFVLLSPELRPCCVLLRDIVAHCDTVARDVARDVSRDAVLELADELWDWYSAAVDVEACSVLCAMIVRGGGGVTARCVQWAGRCVGDDARALHERSAALAALPPGEHATAAYRSFSRALPARLSECVGPHARALRCVLDASSAALHPALLDLLASLAAGDETPGWWDAAMDSCMASLAARAPLETMRALYCRREHNPHSTAVCDRLLAPLIRYSPAGACEQFFSAIVSDLFGTLRRVRAHYCRRQLAANTVAVTLIRLMVEKVPRGSLESPASALHAGLHAGARAWHAAREASKLCAALQLRTRRPADADAALADALRKFQCACFNARCALACVWRAHVKLYAAALDAPWDQLLPAQPYQLPLTALAFLNQPQRTLVTAGEAGGVSSSVSGSGSSSVSGSGSLRRRVFLRTLSECPFEFDLFDEEDEPSSAVELSVSENALNAHPCAGALCSLLRHVAAHAPDAWLHRVLATLGAGSDNVRWFMAQCIVNVRSALAAHAHALSAALLALVCGDAAHAPLHALHLACLETVAAWQSSPASPAPPLASPAARALVRACLHARAQPRVQRALLGTLSTFLRAFPEVELNWDDFRLHLDDPAARASCWRVLARATAARVHVPELGPALVERLENSTQHDKVSQLGGLLAAWGAHAPPAAARRARGLVGALASRRRRAAPARYIHLLYYCACDDAQHFTAVVDVAQKVSAERAKCVAVLANIMRANKLANMLAELPPDLRREVEEKAPDIAFEECISRPPGPPAAKRPRVTGGAMFACEPRMLANTLARLPADKLDEKLTTGNMPLRFMECFYTCVYLPTKYPAAHAPSTFASMFSRMLALVIRPLRAEPRFQRATLPEPVSLCGGEREAGTLRTRTTLAGNNIQVAETPTESVPLTIEKVLDTFLRFGESCPEVSTWLVQQLWRSASAPRELADLLADWLADLLAAGRLLLTLAVELAPTLPNLTGWESHVTSQLARCSGTEAEPYLRLLLEELRLRTADENFFTLGTVAADDDEPATAASEEFCIHALVRALGTLRTRRARPPPLWCARAHFRALVDSYTPEAGGARGWFACCVLAARAARGGARALHAAGGARALHAAGAWPRAQGGVAAVTEAIELPRGGRPGPLRGSRCLAEQAARLMLRALWSEREGDAAGEALSRSHEAAWCRAAIDAGLHRQALLCVHRNTQGELMESEVLSWVVVRAAALRAAGRIDEALRAAELRGLPLCEVSPPRDVIDLHLLILQLHSELASLTDDIVSAALVAARSAGSECERDAARALSEIAILHYDDTWDKREPTVVWASMCDALTVSAGEGGAGLVLRRLQVEGERGEKLTDEAARRVLDALLPLTREHLWCEDALHACLATLAPDALRVRSLAPSHQPDELHKWRRCVQLLCGADVALRHGCEDLLRAAAADDEAAWRVAFCRLKQDVFENEFAGADYHALHKHKQPLYDIEHADGPQRVSAVRGVLRSLRGAVILRRRSVAALCPALLRRDAATNLAALLRLPRGTAAEIDDEVSVLTDSLRLPCVLRVRTGAYERRYLLKRERLALDAAALRAAAALAPAHRQPQVIVLSPECGLIEYLEGCERVRDLVRTECDIDALPARPSSELALPARAHDDYRTLCACVPPDVLRRALWRRSACVEDFLMKQRRFLRDFIDMTLVTWLLGLGDRHLNNIMLSAAHGGVLAVDWGALGAHGGADLPPARLTRLLLALCPPGLEDMLRQALSSLRARRRVLLPRAQLVLHGAGGGPHLLPTLEALLSGAASCREVSREAARREAARREAGPRWQQRVALVDTLLSDLPEKDSYTVEEQVRSLLVLSTSPRALAITRASWEPWL